MPTKSFGGAVTLDSDAVYDSVVRLLERSFVVDPKPPQNNRATIINATTGTYGSNVTTYDMGFVGPLVIGDYVWLDTNANGAQAR